jgi:hypothetical protein
VAIEGKTYKDRRISLDGRNYDRCTFEGCTLTYKGGRAPRFTNCSFYDNQFMFDGPAGNTVGFLQGISHPESSLQGLIFQIFPHLSPPGDELQSNVGGVAAHPSNPA